MSNKKLKFDFKRDLPAGLSVFLVAVPLCLGIAAACDVPLIAGLISGIIGGIVIGFMSNSPLSVSGPAAGLVGVILVAVGELGSYEAFLVAVILAGVLQLLMAVLKLGTIANYFPSNVIKGMLAAIGIIIIRKEIPHFLGYDKEAAIGYTGNEDAFAHLWDKIWGVWDKIWDHTEFITPGAIIIGLICLGILLLWETKYFREKIKFLPGSLIVVIIAIIINQLLINSGSTLALGAEHLVSIPVSESMGEFFESFKHPDFSILSDSNLYFQAVTIALIASIETLLCVEAVDRLDPHKRRTSGNRELYAQGTGNILSGLIGGLPITSVIVRSSANVNAGGKTKMSTIFHGILLLISVILIPKLMNMIPYAALAAILFVVGYKLAKISVFKDMYKNGPYQFWPFIITVLAIVLSGNLLLGVGIGLGASVFSILRSNLKNSYFFHKENHHKGDVIYLHLSEEVSFLNKGSIKKTLDELPAGASVIIDAEQTKYIDYDVLEVIKDFRDVISVERNITLKLVGFREQYRITNTSNVVSQAKEKAVKENLEQVMKE